MMEKASFEASICRHAVRRRGKPCGVAVRERAEGVQGHRLGSGWRRRGRRARARHGRLHPIGKSVRRKGGKGREHDERDTDGMRPGGGLRRLCHAYPSAPGAEAAKTGQSIKKAGLFNSALL